MIIGRFFKRIPQASSFEFFGGIISLIFVECFGKLAESLSEGITEEIHGRIPALNIFKESLEEFPCY